LKIVSSISPDNDFRIARTYWLRNALSQLLEIILRSLSSLRIYGDLTL